MYEKVGHFMFGLLFLAYLYTVILFVGWGLWWLFDQGGNVG